MTPKEFLENHLAVYDMRLEEWKEDHDGSEEGFVEYFFKESVENYTERVCVKYLDNVFESLGSQSGDIIIKVIKAKKPKMEEIL